MPVERVALAPGLEVSRVITGLWQVADMERDGRKLDLDSVADAMVPYVEAGFTTFDMADHYGSAEDVVGRFRRRHPTQRVELLTKWVPKPGKTAPREAADAVRRSLDRMGMERLDLLQFHAWNYADPSWLDCLTSLAELREQGLVRHLGLTNVDAAHLRMVVRSGFPIVSNQVSCSLLDQRAAAGMTDLCRETGTSLLAFGTVAGGFLSERWLGRPDPGPDGLQTWSQMKYRRFIEEAGGWDRFQALLHELADAAVRQGTSIANLACRSVLDIPGVTAIIVGARLGEQAHLRTNADIFSLELDARTRADVSRALGALRQIPGDCGDEYRRPPFLTASGDLSHHLDAFPAPFEVSHGSDGRSWALSGTKWEQLAGYARAVRLGNRVFVSGTTATHGDFVVGGSDPGAQAVFALDKVEGALQSLGASLEDVVRTRVYIRDLADWEPVAREHGRRFGRILPANTLVQAGLVGDRYLVEIEAEAEVSGPRATG